jgi:hypothetical protein
MKQNLKKRNKSKNEWGYGGWISRLLNVKTFIFGCFLPMLKRSLNQSNSATKTE